MNSLQEVPYKNPNLPTEERVEDLLSRMTLSQKIAQLNCAMTYAGSFTGRKTEVLAEGIGQVSALFIKQSAEENAQFLESIQKYLVENTELGIPAIIHTETLSGLGYAEATNFPVAIGLGATWDSEKLQEMGKVISRQMKVLGVGQGFAPVLDVARDLRWGRVGETYGENPTLTAQLGVAYVKGIQGEDLANGVAATSKHFLGYAMSQGGLNMASTDIPPRELREVYAKPFEAAIRKANLASVMNSYSSIDNDPVICSKAILTDLLRGELGFDGITVSDYMAINKIKDEYRMAEDYTQAGILAFEAGMDQELPSTLGYGAGFREAVKQGKVDISKINDSVRRILQLKFKLKLFENPYPDYEGIKKVYHQEKNDELSYQLAGESIVLLKNDDNLLPLNGQCGKVAVIGPNADNLRNVFGGYTYAAFLESMINVMTNMKNSGGMQGVDFGDMSEMPKQNVTIPPYEQILPAAYPMSETILEAIKNKLSEGAVSYCKGCDILSDDKSGFEEAVKVASDADIVIMVVGGKNGAENNCSAGENVDSTSIGLPGVQEELVKAVHHIKTPIILVHMDVRPICSDWIVNNISTILETWYPGQCGAKAVADILFGVLNPGGKLPFTAIRNAGQIPVYADYKRGSGYNDRGVVMLHRLEGGYINESGKALFPFGHGLSYTKFKLDNLRISNEIVPSDGFVRISCTITNIGDRPGDEVVQLYFSDRYASMVRPVKELAGFKRITLRPGEMKTISFKLYANQTAFINKDMKWMIEAGDIDVMLGVSSENFQLRSSFKIVDTVVLDNSTREYYAEVEILKD